MFFKKLYSSNAPATSKVQEYLDNIPFDLTLSVEQMEKCEGMLTEEEYQGALSTLKNNKSPGTDGLTVEFYRTFWEDVKTIFMNAIEKSYNEGELSTSQRRAIITLLYKKGDRTSLKNWRPISLLNIDYKIAAKALAIRLSKVIGSIINEDQSGYLKGQQINTRETD